jgi:HlyD family secretion protein
VKLPLRLLALGSLGLACAAAASAQAVSALGRIVPVGGVIDVIVPGDLVEAVLVREGDWVEAGAPLGRLRSRAGAESKLKQLEAEIAGQQNTLRGEIRLAEIRVTAAEEELRIAEARLNRIAAVRSEPAIAPDKLEERRLARNEANVRLATAREALARARTSADTAQAVGAARLAEARAHLAERSLLAPHKTRVLKILTQAGAPTTAQPLFKLGDTSALQVIAEIYEADALRVQPGRKVSVSSPALPKKISGTVAALGVMVGRNALQSLDPNAATPSRVVEAVIALPDPGPLDRLIFLPVEVMIEP